VHRGTQFRDTCISLIKLRSAAFQKKPEVSRGRDEVAPGTIASRNVQIEFAAPPRGRLSPQQGRGGEDEGALEDKKTRRIWKPLTSILSPSSRGRGEKKLRRRLERLSGPK